MLKRKNALRDTLGDKVFYLINGFFLLLLALIILYPLYFIIIASISDPDAVLGGEVVLYPVRITMDGFAKIIQRQDVWRGYLNTIIYTLLTVVLALIVTIPAGWALSRKTLPGKKVFMIYFIIPMFFGGAKFSMDTKSQGISVEKAWRGLSMRMVGMFREQIISRYAVSNSSMPTMPAVCSTEKWGGSTLRCISSAEIVKIFSVYPARET